jgi:hypothetical protein
VRHNTLLYRASCDWSLPCGIITLDHKSTDPAGTGTVVVDNIATSIAANNGSTYAQENNNLLRSGAGKGDISGSPVYAGGLAPTSIAGYQLASNSPGKGAASSPSGSDIGTTVAGGSSTSSTPTSLNAPTNLRVTP